MFETRELPSLSILTQIKNLGFDLPKINQEFKVFHPDRVVFSFIDDSGLMKVMKIRPSSEDALKEISQLRILIASYSYSGARFPEPKLHYFSSYTGIEMPYLGVDLSLLVQELDEPKEGQVNQFLGFSARQIQLLYENFEKEHLQFARRRGLIHGDLFQKGAANNLVYNRALNKLLAIDAEALGEFNSERENRFFDQMRKVEEWFYLNLSSGE